MLLLLQRSYSVNGEAGTFKVPLFQHGWLIGALATSNGVFDFPLMGKDSLHFEVHRHNMYANLRNLI